DRFMLGVEGLRANETAFARSFLGIDEPIEIVTVPLIIHEFVIASRFAQLKTQLAFVVRLKVDARFSGSPFSLRRAVEDGAACSERQAFRLRVFAGSAGGKAPTVGGLPIDLDITVQPVISATAGCDVIRFQV